MKISKKLIALGLIVTSLSVVGCSSQEQETQVESATQEISTISIAASGDAMNFNPLYANDRVSMTVMNTIFNPLYVVEEDGQKTFYLAENITASEDFLTYTLTLKDNLKWHDNTPLTADDIVFTVQTILDEAQVAKDRGNFVIGDSEIIVNKIDDKTVEFVLPQVTTSIENVIGSIRPIPKHIYEGVADISKSEKNQIPIGNGPYKFAEYKTGELITLEKFEDFYGKKAELDTVTYRIIPDSNTANIALQNSEIQAKYVLPDELETIEQNENVDVITYDEGMVDTLVMYQDNNEQLKNVKVRQALSYAINREEIITAAYKSEEYADKATSLFAPTTIGFTQEVENFDYDLEKSKQLLKELGVNDLKLTLAYGTHKSHLESIALTIQSNLQKAGVEVELMPMESSAFFSQIRAGKEREFDLALNSYVMGSDPSQYGAIFKTDGPNNIQAYSNKEVDELFDLALEETDEAKRNDLYEKIQKIVSEEVSLYSITYPKSIVAIDSKYDGVDEATPAPIFMFRDLNELKLK